MALVVEDGSGLAGANTLAGLDTADAYHAERGNQAWASAATAAREAALIRGSAFLGRRYRWRGYRLNQDQALCWPRGGVTDGDGWLLPWDRVPRVVVQAACEAALRELAAPLDPDLPRGGRVLREKVDALEVEYHPAAPAGEAYPVLDGLLAGLARPAGTAPLRRV